MGVNVLGGLCPGGICPRVYVSGGGGGGGKCPCQGVICPGVYVLRVSVRGVHVLSPIRSVLLL